MLLPLDVPLISIPAVSTKKKFCRNLKQKLIPLSSLYWIPAAVPAVVPM